MLLSTREQEAKIRVEQPACTSKCSEWGNTCVRLSDRFITQLGTELSFGRPKYVDIFVSCG